MRLCPKCSFNNEEGFATCAWCNTSLAHAEWLPHPDPSHPDHEQRRRQQARGRRYHRQLMEAIVIYSFVIAFLTLVGTGYEWHPLMLLCALASGAITGAAVVFRWVGQLTALFLQGTLGVLIVLHFGMGTPAMFFGLGAYVFAAVLFSIWVDHIHDANR